MIGSVENDDPIPIVTIKPTMSITNAPIALLLPNSAAEASTSVSTWPVAVMTAAKPWAVIMMNPMSAIIFMPEVNTSSASFQFTAPVTRNTARPVSAPMSRESASESASCITTCTINVARIAMIATMIL